MLVRLLLGLVKGAAVGGAVGYGAYSAGLDGGWNWLTYGIVGVFVGLLVGQPLWAKIRDPSSTVWTTVLKSVFGYGVGVGIYALIAKVWGGFDLTIAAIADEPRNIINWQFIIGPAIGGLYGAFVEVDDGIDSSPEPKQPRAQGKPQK